jgi:hypothetical protein
MERVEKAIAFSGLYVGALGATLLLVGLASPGGWAYLRTHSYAPAKLSIPLISDGPLRPSMALLPAMPDGKRFIISDRPVPFDQFSRIVGQIGTEESCGFEPLSRGNPGRSVTCQLTIREAINYANLLTERENAARSRDNRTSLTLCYKVTADSHFEVRDNNTGLSCTGYRLPTIEEWTYAATAGLDTSTTSALQAQLARGDEHGCRADAWFIFDMCDAPELAVTPDREGRPVVIEAGGVGVVTSQYYPPSVANFRVVRIALEEDLF